MNSVSVSIFVWVLYFALTALIIRTDAVREQKKARERGEVDFLDRKISSYIVFALICGPLPLIAYFGLTRKSFVGWLMGFGVAAALLVVIWIVATVLILATRGVQA